MFEFVESSPSNRLSETEKRVSNYFEEEDDNNCSLVEVNIPVPIASVDIEIGAKSSDRHDYTYHSGRDKRLNKDSQSKLTGFLSSDSATPINNNNETDLQYSMNGTPINMQTDRISKSRTMWKAS